MADGTPICPCTTSFFSSGYSNEKKLSFFQYNANGAQSHFSSLHLNDLKIESFFSVLHVSNDLNSLAGDNCPLFVCFIEQERFTVSRNRCSPHLEWIFCFKWSEREGGRGGGRLHKDKHPSVPGFSLGMLEIRHYHLGNQFPGKAVFETNSFYASSNLNRSKGGEGISEKPSYAAIRVIR